jgi:outer membrane protein assembly factor BamA
MRKFLLQISLIGWLFGAPLAVFSQSVSVQWIRVDSLNLTTKSNWVKELGLLTNFQSSKEFRNYCRELPVVLQSKGYIAASLDQLDSVQGKFIVHLYLGQQYRWKKISGLSFANKPADPGLIQRAQQELIRAWSNQGYPFAKVFLDSIQVDSLDYLTAVLRTEKGPFYKIDSVYNTGNVRLSNRFLSQWLAIPAGTAYSQKKLDEIPRKLQELDYLKESKPYELELLGSGAAVHTFLEQQKSSQFNGLLGFLPNNQQLSSRKLLVVGEANLLLRNAFGQGETLGLNWQQLQVQSPRLNLLYRHPYFLGSRFGLDLSFNFFRKDSSFINLDWQLGARYQVEGQKEFQIFMRQQVSNLSNGAIDAQKIITTRQLPVWGDVTVSSAGLDFSWNKTDYRVNPRKGNEGFIQGTAGRRKTRRNPDIVSLKDPNDPTYNFASLYDSVGTSSYQFSIKTTLATYLPLGTSASVLKLAAQAGWVQSPRLYQNEFFQLGGFRLLRGFDEQSQYLSRYLVLTTEYRYLAAKNSYFYALLDAGWGAAPLPDKTYLYGYIGTGLGMAFETKAGILNLAWAVGKRSDANWDFRQSKIHVGLTNYF